MGTLAKWSSKITQNKLHEYMRNNKNITWVEIGVCAAETLNFVMKKYGNNFNKLYLIDPYCQMEINTTIPGLNGKHRWSSENRKIQKKTAVERLNKWSEICVWFEDYSDNVHQKIDNNSIDILNIDGDHSYNAVYKDLINYYPKVKLGGLIILDDTDQNDIKRALSDFCKKMQIKESDIINDKPSPVGTSYFVKC
jgi:hypothetical protein